MVERAKELGQTALGIMDHGTCSGHVEFYRACLEADIKPILGIEPYLVESFEDKTRSPSHIGIVAMNEKGLENINKLTAIAAENFYFKPRISLDSLEKHNEGLIVFSGCYASLISQAALNDEDDKAKRLIGWFKDLLGDRFYIEIQDSGVPGQPKITRKLRRWAKKFDLPAIVTVDSHYVLDSDAFAHSVLLAINTNAKMTQKPTYEGGKRFAFSTDEYYMKNSDKLLDEGWSKEEIETSQKIADRCDVTIDRSIKIPTYPFLPKGVSSIDYLKELCRQGWTSKRVGEKKGYNYNERVIKELRDIEECNIADYFLIVQNYIRWAKSNGIEVGDGRGSAAGSMVGYLLDITTIDPLKYSLYWERFWNKGRANVGLPDIDSDFSQSNRQDILKYIQKTFSKEKVLPVLSFGKMVVRGVLKDVGRAFGVPADEMNRITANVSSKTKTIEEALDESVDLRIWEKKYKKVFSIAKQLQNTERHTSIHPSALIVLDRKVERGLIPLSWDTKSKKKITGYDFHSLEYMGMLKLDVLGLKNLDILSITRDLVNQNGD